ncbi:9-O-acetylesterase [Spirochaetia bacterium]|nr:9-O-acetylesterase [Spirochaetia bacterium]
MLKLSKLFSDGMVLQRDREVKVWGSAGPGETVTVTLAGATGQTLAGLDGKWLVTLPPKPAGGPFEMTAAAGSGSLRINDVLLGDVWVLSGQSNMAVSLFFAQDDLKKELAEAGNYPEIRQFQVPFAMDFSGPQEDFSSNTAPMGPPPGDIDEDAPSMPPFPPSAVWNRATPDTIGSFSAVGYFFAKTVYDTCKVPIGLISAAVGGVPIDSFMSREALAAYPLDIAEAAKWIDPLAIKRLAESDAARLAAWNRAVDDHDPGVAGNWHEPGFDDGGWQNAGLCDNWLLHPDMPANGSVWFRREITVPPELAGKKARLSLGMLVEGDRCYVNGVLVGQADTRWFNRNYAIKGGLKPGRNVIVIRLLSQRNVGRAVPGSRSETTQRIIFPETPEKTIQLDQGDWKYHTGTEWGRLDEATTIFYKPTCLYNAMIAPLHHYGIKGVCWYQGESHSEKPNGHADRFCSMITDWRAKWGQGDFPVFWVQLPNFRPLESTATNWAYVREEQRRCLRLINSGMVVTIDVGDSWDMHPTRKAIVGKRMGLAALKVAYGKDIVAGGPVYRDCVIYGNEAMLRFESVGGGLATGNGKELGGFTVFDGVHQYPAEAEIRGSEIAVKCPAEAAEIRSVRYAWESDPLKANLTNAEGLPASPFDSCFSR